LILEEAKEAAIAVTQVVAGAIGEMGGWPTLIERIAGLERGIPANAVLFGPSR
jgi:hypothetical protein